MARGGASTSCGPGTEAPRMAGDPALPLPPQTFPVPSAHWQPDVNLKENGRGHGVRAGAQARREEDSNLHPSAPPSASSQHPNLERNLPGGWVWGLPAPTPVLT